MPVTYEIDPSYPLIRTSCSGPRIFDEVLAPFRALEADPAIEGEFDVLLDLTELDTIPETPQLKSVVDRVGRLLTKVQWGACAIVASRDVLFGISRMFEVFSQSSFTATHVFRKRAEAEAWLAGARAGCRRATASRAPRA